MSKTWQELKTAGRLIHDVVNAQIDETVPKAWVYLLHFHKPYPNGHKPSHYIGVASDLEKRMQEHRSGSSKCRLTRALWKAGIGFTVVQKWPFWDVDKAFEQERKLKRRHRHSDHCPICQKDKDIVIKDVYLD